MPGPFSLAVGGGDGAGLNLKHRLYSWLLFWLGETVNDDGLRGVLSNS